MDNKTKGLLKSALLGWGVAFFMIYAISGSEAEGSFALFLSLAPGAIGGILVYYILSKGKDDKISVRNKTPEERLLDLKKIL